MPNPTGWRWRRERAAGGKRQTLCAHRDRKPFAPLARVAQEAVECGLALKGIVPDLCQGVGDPGILLTEQVRTQTRRQGHQPVDGAPGESAVGGQASAS